MLMQGTALADRPIDDDALMARVGARETAAFALLADRHAGLARRIGYRMLGDAAEAEDVAQEALLRLWARAVDWRSGQTGVAAWLTRVAMNLCLDRLRRQRFHSDAEVPDRADETPLADAVLDDARTRQIVVRCIGALNERQRAAIVLTYYEELPNIMAADALELNIKAFESLLLRARKTLREALSEAGIVDREGAAA